MATDDDVIELGADGTFDIPSPPKNSQRAAARKLDEVQEEQQECYMPPQISLSDEVLAKMQPGEFRVYQHQNKSKGGGKQQYVIVMRLQSCEKPQVKAYVSHITVSSSESSSVLKIDISKLDVDVKTTHVQHWNDFITIRLSK